MLSKEQREELKAASCGHGFVHDKLLRDALQHIAELEENATAKALALKAAKAMQQAETERADANKRDAERYRWLRTADPDKIQDPELCEAVGNLPAEPTDVDDAIDQAMSNL